MACAAITSEAILLYDRISPYYSQADRKMNPWRADGFEDGHAL
jgi:hypothetical protein